MSSQSFARSRPGQFGAMSPQELGEELTLRTEVAENPRARHAERVLADAEAKAIRREIAARGLKAVRVGQQQAATNAGAEPQYAEPVAYFATQAAQGADAPPVETPRRTVTVIDTWVNALDEVVVAHAAGLIRLPAGSKVERGQTIEVE